MRLVLILLIGLSTQGFAQTFHYFRVNMGPKLEYFQVQNAANLEMLAHIDVGAGVYIGKRFNEKFSAEVGIVKNDYTARFEINTKNPEGKELSLFGQSLYPTYSSYQIAVLGQYRVPINEKWIVYSNVGFHAFLTKNLSREGILTENEIIYANNGDEVDNMELIYFSNDFEGGNLIFRADLGVYRNITDNLAIDMSISGRAASQSISEFTVEYKSNLGASAKNILISNHAASWS
ncbi:MAG: outer membrane beta-barrel protein, partial [Bacteroidia bacterium]|nr:outer membrane beta-barrel protein [Bacteroidia bacterium]